MNMSFERPDLVWESMQQKLSQGNKWVAYPPADPQLRFFDLQYFKSAADAERFCLDQSLVSVMEPAQMGYGFYQFKALPSMIRHLEAFLLEKPLSKLPEEEVLKIVESFKFKVSGYNDFPQRLTEPLQYGDVLSLELPRAIVPARHIDNFHLIQHNHEMNSTIYEIGHSIKRLGTFADQTSALKAFDAFKDSVPVELDRSYSELLLVAKYADTSLELGMEGHPKLNTGMTLMLATKGGGELQLVKNDPFMEMKYHQEVFFSIDPITRKPYFYDDGLNLYNPAATLRSVNGSMYDNLPPSIIPEKSVKPRIIKDQRQGKGPRFS